MTATDPPARATDPSATTLRVECGQSSDPGRDPTKQVNEDSAGFATTRYGELFVVCDGMGGHSGGQQASEIAIRTVFEMMGRVDGPAQPRDALREAIEEAGRRVYRFGGPPQNLFRPGSTCVAVLLRGDRAETAHVGDSRAYAVRGGRIFRLTRDHSLVQDLIDSGALTEEQAIGHPDANKITRALGMTPEVEVELRVDPLEVFAGDVFVLCTDGLTDMVPQEQILAVVRSELETAGSQSCAAELVRLANENGGHDNITVQIIHVKATGPRRANTLAQGPSVADGPPAAEHGDEAAESPPEPPTATSAPDTLLDDTRPTVVDSSRAPRPVSGRPGPGAQATEPEGPAVALAANPAPRAGGRSRPPPSPIGPTEPGVPAPLAGASGSIDVPAPSPGRPQPTVVDPTLAGAPVALGTGRPRVVAPPAAVGDTLEPEPGTHPLLYVVVVLAIVIGVLLAVLLWSSFGR